MRTIGDILRKARIEKGLTIEELQQATKIQTRYLELIEANKFDELPGDYYARSFIRQYANEVGEDGDYLADRFDGVVVADNVAVEVTEVEEERSDLSRERYSDRKPNVVKSNLPMLLLFAVAAFIIFGIGFLTLRSTDDEPLIEKADKVVVKKKEPIKKEDVEEAPDDLDINFDSQEGYNVTMTVSNAEGPLDLEFLGKDARCWIGVMIDGEYVYDQTLEAGETGETTLPDGTTQARIVLGNISNAEVKINGQELEFNPEGDEAVKRNIKLLIE